MAATMMMAGHAGHTVHPFFKQRQNNVVDTGTDSDIEEPKRKRQRTNSLGMQLAVSSDQSDWKKERDAVTDGGQGPSGLVERHNVAGDTADGSLQRDRGANEDQTTTTLGTPFPAAEMSRPPAAVYAHTPVVETPPKRVMRVRSDGKLASPKARVENPTAEVVGELARAAQPQEITGTPPKKMLKVRADGKLSSPDAKVQTRGSKPMGRKRVAKADIRAKLSCIVVIPYGTDENARASLGRHIGEILSGVVRKPDPRPPEPPKSTHPFFTGGLGQKPDQRLDLSTSKQPNVTEASTQPVKRTYGSTESRITSKPPGILEASAIAYGPSFPTIGTDHAKVTRFPGARDPIWPPYDMLHIGRSSSRLADSSKMSIGTDLPSGGRKLKNTQIQILPEENILKNVTNLAHLYDNNAGEMQAMTSRDFRQFRRPRRKVMTGQELQRAICSRIAYSLPCIPTSGYQDEDELSSSQTLKPPTHAGLVHVYNSIPRTRTAFDQYRCETQEWTHKYAPKRAEHVLQQGRETVILRDWLKGLTVTLVGSGNVQSKSRDSSVMGRRGAKPGRKRRRRAEELDGFVVSSDEEANEMDEIPDPEDFGSFDFHGKKSVMRVNSAADGKRTANSVVISGPHGCGKTAAVFAVAQELGFEIFEVNAGSRRSGKDILDKVGDMTRNHLVTHRQDEEVAPTIDQSAEMLQLNEKLQADLHSGRQGTMKSFFQTKSMSKTTQSQDKSEHAVLKKTDSKKTSPKKKSLQETFLKQQTQKQSLILLEEVDVLFEEDKAFWATVLELILISKRPVVMTCSDETFLPLDGVALHAILRFTAPPTELAVDYLLLVAASEGHLLSRDSVQLLYDAKGSDLRASLAELNLYCQMGVGDKKGGLEWMLIDKPFPISQVRNDEPLRVVSEDTYCRGMGWLGGEDVSSRQCSTIDDMTEVCAGVWHGWDLDIGATEVFLFDKTSRTDEDSRRSVMLSLQDVDETCEAFSAADILPASVVRHASSAALDTAQPGLTDRLRCSYIDGPRLLEADLLVDHSGMSDSIALALRGSAALSSKETELPLLTVQKAIGNIPQLLQQQRSYRPMAVSSASSAFEPIAKFSPAILGLPKGPSITSFDNPISTIVKDVAPYVREIVSYDLRLEEQRRQLSSLLEQPGAGSRKTRTTRASRAALEGGSKANTRRERWFPKTTDFNAILQTGGKQWQEVARQTVLGHSEDQSADENESRASSLVCGDGTDIGSF